MRIATYQRISTDEERQPFSLEAQTDRLAAYIAVQPGWRLTHAYSDQMSGKRLDRPGLVDALAGARAGRYDLLLVFKVDRLARSVGGWHGSWRSWTAPGSPSARLPSRLTPRQRPAG
jgi:site-specific DNA recombinase